MATKIVDTILPTTMVGSYPRPHWFKHQLLGRDVRVAFKEVQHEEAYDDAVAKLEIGHVVKFVFRFRERFWKDEALNFLHTDDRYVPTYWTAAASSGMKARG